MAFLIFHSAATWTGIVPARLEDYTGYSVRGSIFHDVCCLSALTKLISHEPHGAIYVPEELPVA